jgi:hypothetical protein
LASNSTALDDADFEKLISPTHDHNHLRMKCMDWHKSLKNWNLKVIKRKLTAAKKRNEKNEFKT